MSKNLSKLLALALALVMVLGLAACGGTANTTPTEAPAPTQSGSQGGTQETSPTEAPAETPEPDLRPAKDVYKDFDATDWWDESEELYEEVLGEFLDNYALSKDAKSLSERYALEAVAEGKLLAAGVMVPLTTRGGNYGLRRIAPKTINTTLWGSNEYRYETVIPVEEMVTAEDWNAMKALWIELAGTGTYEQAVKDYLDEHGYTRKDVFNYEGYNTDPETWDVLASSRSVVAEPLAVTVDGLYQYDMENVQQPALALSHDESADGLTYTFHLREGVVWVDSQGRKVADLTADDFVAGLQHLMDDPSSPAGLLIGVIKNAAEYINGDITDFDQVGVKALDDYTVEYTLETETPYFLSMLAYNIFLPLSRSYYTSQGGKFGTEYDTSAGTYLYGKDPDHIAYCGPMLVTNYTEKNTVVYQANPAYWNADALNVHTINWRYWDGSDTLKGYNDLIAGECDTIGLNSEALEKAKSEGNFDDYAVLSDTDATSYMGWLNLNRKIYTNFNNPDAVVSPKTVYEADRTVAALGNLHFRRGLLASFDHASYNAQSVGEELKLNALRNGYTPATFVSLTEAVTVDINGKAATFPAGTFYGEIEQAVLDADGVKAKVWDAATASGDGFDGWYNPDYAASELALAVSELAEDGVTLDADNPIYIDYPYYAESTVSANRANAVKQSIESTSGGLIVVNLVACNNQDEYYDNAYYTDNGYEQNSDLNTSSGWAPDYGDPQTYLSTLIIDEDGYMLANIGLFGH